MKGDIQYMQEKETQSWHWCIMEEFKTLTTH